MLNVFLLLPQNDNAILEIIQDKNSYQQLIKEISETVSALPKDNSVKLFYDLTNIQTFIAACSEFADETYLNNAIAQIRYFISLKSINIQEKPSKNNSCLYILWNLDKLLNVEYAPEIIAETAEKIHLFPNEQFLLLNISENIKADRNVLLVCKDAKHIPELPVFARIPYVTDKSELELWLAANHITTFSLLNKNYFIKTNKTEQGQRIYQEIETSHYWYLDNFHKNHYEVFDETGKHLGEADLQGQLDEAKQDARKRINL